MGTLAISRRITFNAIPILDMNIYIHCVVNFDALTEWRKMLQMDTVEYVLMGEMTGWENSLVAS